MKAIFETTSFHLEKTRDATIYRTLTCGTSIGAVVGDGQQCLVLGYIVRFWEEGELLKDMDFHAEDYQCAYEMLQAWVNPEEATS